MVVWGGSWPGGALATGARYNPSLDSWVATSGAGAPSPRFWHTAVWSGKEMIVWGGYPHGPSLADGGRYDPQTNTWTAIPVTTDSPAGRFGHSGAWSGREMLVWGGQLESNVLTDTGARFDPRTGQWQAIPPAGGPSGRYDQHAAWTGDGFVVWGGWNAGGYLLDGARYSPTANAWTPLSIGPTSPSPRNTAASIWTGRELIVWGGWNNGVTDTGDRYQAELDTWTAIPTSDGMIAPRYNHRTVWTGTQMLVWGGARAGGLYCVDSCPSPILWYQDHDADQFGSPAPAIPACGPLAGQISTPGDCDDANAAVHPTALEVCNQVDDDCSGAVDDDDLGEDTDGDGLHNVCDNCRTIPNPGQADLDSDAEGDLCDPDDGTITLYWSTSMDLRWQEESGHTSWNVYQGDLVTLRSTGAYTQVPASNPNAVRACGVPTGHFAAFGVPAVGTPAFQLVTGLQGGVEGSLGTNSQGMERTNGSPCP
jgi:hypothetical protein